MIRLAGIPGFPGFGCRVFRGWQHELSTGEGFLKLLMLVTLYSRVAKKGRISGLEGTDFRSRRDGFPALKDFVLLVLSMLKSSSFDNG